ncbi:hypothetical protein ACE1ET_01535 [Saccharicrinis sp. FJH62]|uniref:hypothetical protein n=1 Tax=Saccharicrinis sp. FJH62 TaxID=3344657 RepID=UPI0035D524C8
MKIIVTIIILINCITITYSQNIDTTKLCDNSDYELIPCKKNHYEPTRCRITLNSGFAYIFSKASSDIPTEYKNYYDALRSGINYSGDATYYLTKNIGIGFKLLRSYSHNRMDNIVSIDEDGNRHYGNKSDKLSISFIGPSISSRFYHNENIILANVSIGYIEYSNERVIIENYPITGYTFGLTYDLGYDFHICQNIYLGFQLSLISGFSYQFESGNSELLNIINTEFKSPLRFDISTGLRYYF